MADAGDRIARRVDDDVDVVAPDRRVDIGREIDARRSRSASQPSPGSLPRARSGSRSAMARTAIPGIVGAWVRNIDPNFPAPISATPIGPELAARFSAS